MDLAEKNRAIFAKIVYLIIWVKNGYPDSVKQGFTIGIGF